MNRKLFLESKLLKKEKEELDSKEFGLPKLKKYPLNDKNHVIAAIKMFHNCEEQYRKELAFNIYKASLKYEVEISTKSLVFKYLPEDKQKIISENKFRLSENNFDLDFKTCLRMDISDYKRSKLLNESELIANNIISDKGKILLEDNEVIAVTECSDEGFLNNFKINDLHSGTGIEHTLLSSVKNKVKYARCHKDNFRLASLLEESGYKIINETRYFLLYERKNG